jgi:hypothetical protein
MFGLIVCIGIFIILLILLVLIITKSPKKVEPSFDEVPRYNPQYVQKADKGPLGEAGNTIVEYPEPKVSTSNLTIITDKPVEYKGIEVVRKDPSESIITTLKQNAERTSQIGDQDIEDSLLGVQVSNRIPATHQSVEDSAVANEEVD